METFLILVYSTFAAFLSAFPYFLTSIHPLLQVLFGTPITEVPNLFYLSICVHLIGTPLYYAIKKTLKIWRCTLSFLLGFTTALSILFFAFTSTQFSTATAKHLQSTLFVIVCSLISSVFYCLSFETASVFLHSRVSTLLMTPPLIAYAFGGDLFGVLLYFDAKSLFPLRRILSALPKNAFSPNMMRLFSSNHPASSSFSSFFLLIVLYGLGGVFLGALLRGLPGVNACICESGKPQRATSKQGSKASRFDENVARLIGPAEDGFESREKSSEKNRRGQPVSQEIMPLRKVLNVRLLVGLVLSASLTGAFIEEYFHLQINGKGSARAVTTLFGALFFVLVSAAIDLVHFTKTEAVFKRFIRKLMVSLCAKVVILEVAKESAFWDADRQIGNVQLGMKCVGMLLVPFYLLGVTERKHIAHAMSMTDTSMVLGALLYRGVRMCCGEQGRMALSLASLGVCGQILLFLH